MRAAATLALVVAGAILTFAVSAQVPGISLRLTGVIIMLAGAAVTLLPPSPAAGWLRRRGRPEPQSGPGPDSAGADLDAEYPAYLLQDPAVLAFEVLNGIRADSGPRNSGSPNSGPPNSGPPNSGPPNSGPQDSWPQNGWSQPAAARAGSRSGRPDGPRPLHSVRFDPEDGVG